MQNKKVDFFYNILFANDLANDENEWKPYFNSLAKHYIEAFSSNMDIFQNLINQLKSGSSKNSAENEIIYKELVNYYQTYKALSPQSDGSFEPNDEIMDRFEPVTYKTKLEPDLGLKDYQLMGEKFTLKQLMNIVISFYKNSETRKQFFKRIISESKDKIDEITLNDVIPSKTILKNDFNGRLAA